MINWISTTINHGPRKELGLSCDEFALLDLIFKTQTHPSYSDNGWCTHSYAVLADVLGIGKGGVFKMVERLTDAELLEVNAANPKQKRATHKFYSIAYVQKVNEERSLSERHRSKSERHIKYNKENNSLSTKSEIRSHRVAQAMETIKSHVGVSLATMATVFTEISPGDLNLQVEKWLKYYIGNDEVMSDPIAALTTGPCSFERWIERAKDVTKKRKPKDMTIVYNSYLKWVKENYSDVKPLSSDEYLRIEAYKKRCELRDQTIIMGLVSSSHYDVFFSGGDLVEILNSKLSSNRYPTIEEMAAKISQLA